MIIFANLLNLIDIFMPGWDGTTRVQAEEKSGDHWMVILGQT
jgi:hypothetical protein